MYFFYNFSNFEICHWTPYTWYLYMEKQDGCHCCWQMTKTETVWPIPRTLVVVTSLLMKYTHIYHLDCLMISEKRAQTMGCQQILWTKTKRNNFRQLFCKEWTITDVHYLSKSTYKKNVYYLSKKLSRWHTSSFPVVVVEVRASTSSASIISPDLAPPNIYLFWRLKNGYR